jgi:hypothetical protein
MKKFQRLQRRIKAEQQGFIMDVITDVGLKVCDYLDRPPEGQSVYIEPDSHQVGFAHYNFKLTPCFAVPNYMSVNKSSPTFTERAAQEKEAIRGKLIEALQAEGLLNPYTENEFTNDVVVWVAV